MKSVISVLLISLFLAPVLTGCANHCGCDKQHKQHKMENEHGDKC